METTKNYGLKKPAQSDFYNVDDFNYNVDIIDDELKKKFDPDNPPTPEQVKAIARINRMLDGTVEVLDTLITAEYAGDWGWLSPEVNPFGYPLGALCVVTNHIIQYVGSYGVTQIVSPVYPTNSCGEIFLRSFYYGNAYSGGSEWTDWEKLPKGKDYLPITGGQLTGNLFIHKAVTPALEFDTNKSVAQITKNASDTVEDGLIIKDCDSNTTTTDFVTLRLNHNLAKKDIKQMLKVSKVEGGKSTFYNIYGTHNKPTPDDIGAIAKTIYIDGKTIPNDALGIVKDGWYYGTQMANVPTSIKAGYLRVMVYADTYRVVSWRPHNSQAEYVNVLNGGAWTGWAEILTDKTGQARIKTGHWAGIGGTNGYMQLQFDFTPDLVWVYAYSTETHRYNDLTVQHWYPYTNGFPVDMIPITSYGNFEGYYNIMAPKHLYHSDSAHGNYSGFGGTTGYWNADTKTLMWNGSNTYGATEWTIMNVPGYTYYYIAFETSGGCCGLNE